MKIFTIAAVGLLASVSAGYATPAPTTAISGSYSVSYTKAIGNGPSFSDDLSSNFTENLAVNSPTTATRFFAVSPAGSCGSCSGSPGHNTASGTISVTFTFSSPVIGSSPIKDTAAYIADYSNDTDSVTWAGSLSNLSSAPPIVVDFQNGAVLDIDVVNAHDWTIYPQIYFDLVKGPTSAVAEPASVGLVGAGLVGIGFFVMRRRKKTLACA